MMANFDWNRATWLGSQVLLLMTCSAIRLPAQEQSNEPTPLRQGVAQRLQSVTQQADDVLQEAQQRYSESQATLRKAQAYETVGKQLYPAQPSGRTTLQRTHASPWLERFMTRRQSESTQSTPPVNRTPSTTPAAGQSPTHPNYAPRERSPQSAPPARTSQTPGQSQGFSMRRPQTESLPSSPQRTAPPSTSRNVAQPPSRVDARGSSRNGSPQLPPAQDMPAADLSNDTPAVVNEPPRVSRVPLPSASQRFQEHAAEAIPSTNGDQSIPTDSNRSPTTNPGETTSLANRPARVEPPKSPDQDTEADTGQSVAVPTRLANVPLSERAAQQQMAEPELPYQSSTPQLTTPSETPNSQPQYLLGGNQSPTETQPTAPGQRPFQEIASEAAREPTRSRNFEPSVFGSGGPNTSNDRVALERMRMQNPSVEVILTGPSKVPVGTPAKYQIEVRNEDRLSLQGLILRLDVPAGVQVQPRKPTHGDFELETAPDGATLMTWGLENLGSNEVALAPVTMSANSSKDFAMALDWTLVPMSSTANVQVISPKLAVAIQGPSEVIFGAKNSYRLLIQNSGEAAAKNVTVDLGAERFGSSSAELGDIPAGEQKQVDIELQFKEQGEIKISAVASADGNLKSNAAMNVRVQRAELVAALNGPRMVYHGAETSYEVALTNRGDAPSHNLMAGLRLPPGAKPVGNLYGGSVQGDVLSWPVESMSPNETKTFRIQIDLAGEGENTLELRCVDNAGNSAGDEVSTLVESIADLKLLVSDPVAPAPVGSEVVYELLLTNRGSKAARDVKVIAQFSSGIEPTRGEGHDCRVVPGQIFFDPIDSVEAGETIKLQVFATATSDGMHRFRTEVRADAADIRLVQEESTQFLDADARLARPREYESLR